MAAMQAEREAASQEALALRQEVERVMTRHQERVAKWEAAAAADEAQLTQRKSAMEVPACSSHCSPVPFSFHKQALLANTSHRMQTLHSLSQMMAAYRTE